MGQLAAVDNQPAWQRRSVKVIEVVLRWTASRLLRFCFASDAKKIVGGKMLKELIQERQTVWASMKALNDKVELEKRDFTAEEKATWEKLNTQMDSLAGRIDRDKRIQDEERKQAENALHTQTVNPPQTQTLPELQMLGLRSWLQTGQERGEGAPEFRALQADADISGGYLVMPQEFVSQLIKGVDNAVFIRQLASKFQVANAASLGVPSISADPADADWTSELGTGNEDSTMAFGKRELTPHPLAKRIKVSNKLLRSATLPAEQIVRDRLAYVFGISEEQAFLTGSGAQQPLGLFTASASGISTGRDVSTGNTTTAVTLDGLIEAKYSLKSQYWARARWLFSRTLIKNVRKLKDGEGQYQWQASLVAGTPDMLLGAPVMVSEYVPATFTTGLYVGMIGDYSNYWIADSLSMQIQRLVELYAATNQTGLIGRIELDGMPVLEEAFARVKLG